MAGELGLARRLGARAFGAVWEARRRLYASGVRRPRAVGARVVSIGNLTVGGTGKTTLALHLMRRALERGVRASIVCRRYHPGPAGRGDEELMFGAAFGEARVFAGRSKRALAAAAAAAGAELVFVDDGFSHWALARELDIVLLEAGDPWGGGALLPAGRLREPRRALQRAGAVVISRVPLGQDPAAEIDEARAFAPAAVFAAGRHRVTGARDLAGAARATAGPVRIVTATGNPAAVERSAREAGFAVTATSAYRDHHWFTADEARRELAAAEREHAQVLVTAKDAVRWPGVATAAPVVVLEVDWEWVSGGERLERLVFEGEEAAWTRPTS